VVWTAGSTISVQVINDIGMSLGQGVWSGFVALTSFLWGAFGHEFFSVFTAVTMRSRTGAMVGLALLMTGIALLAAVGGAAGEVREVPGKPLICAPLDAVEFMREYDRAALTEVTGAVADSLRPLPDDADDADGGLNLDILLPSGQGPWGGLS
jgi:hypothetical protein